jgi:hypothetical protein
MGGADAVAAVGQGFSSLLGAAVADSPRRHPRGAKLSPNGDAIERHRRQAWSWVGAGPINRMGCAHPGADSDPLVADTVMCSQLGASHRRRSITGKAGEGSSFRPETPSASRLGA